jgi:arginyl-tRNA synthetase
LKSGGSFFKKNKKNEKVIIEYVSANPTGYLHLAHFRQAVIGDTLSRIYNFLGFEVTREYYINDRGKQIDSLVESIFHLYSRKNENKKNEKIGENLSYLGKSSQETANILYEK